MGRCLRIAPTDNMAMVLEPVAAGIRVAVEGASVTTQEDIPQGHKPALIAIPAGTDVIKYGYPIGRARTEIQPGQWAHTHNLATRLDGADVPQAQAGGGAPAPPRLRSFQDYHRADGWAGTRNELWIMSTMGCVNGVTRSMVQRVEDYAKGWVDGAHVWSYPYGCSQMGEDQEHTRAILCGLIHHPSAGGVLVLGLGCEDSSIAMLQERLGHWDSQRVAFLECQAMEDELAEGEHLLRELADRATADWRKPMGADELVVGLKCGGPDGFSGITVNPLTSRVTDRVIAVGSSVLLAEVPEMFGAEGVLFWRYADKGVTRALPVPVEEFKDYFTRHGQVVYENPPPGNKAGGITTPEEKSLGCVQKGGNVPIVDVFRYGETVRRRGLTVFQTPGNDSVSATGLAVTGARLILLTTGRGTPFGAPVPTLKLATNTALANRKTGWIDYDAGDLVQGDAWEPHTQVLFRLVLDTASDALTRAEAAGYREIVTWKDGVTL